jgi:glycerol-3-phosphate dehydrogenase
VVKTGNAGTTGHRELSRAAALQQIAERQFDVLVVGGGITGAGVALDAAARGFATALVEKGDFAAGTSSESSKLVHGGLRYLQQYEVGLVFQSLAERQSLLHNAPHLVRRQLFVIPILGTGGVVDKTVARTYSLGLWFYDLFGGFQIGRFHRRLRAEEIQRHLPTLRLDLLVAGFMYFDAWADDARLTLAIAQTAALEFGAVIMNHAPAVALLKDASGKVRGARITPEDGPPGGIEVAARVVVNATGVWADAIRDLDVRQTHLIRPVKGIHVALPNEKLPCDAAVVLPSPRDGRNVFVIPWGDKTYVGTTDTDYQGDLDHPGVQTDEVDYLLEAVNAAVSKPVERSDVTGTWSGLRPLLAAGGRRRAPSARTADLSRCHKVLESPSGVVTITGGKLTTYRKMADDTVDAVARALGSDRRRCLTKHLVIRGSRNLQGLQRPGTAARFGLTEETFSHLLSRYGDQVGDVVDIVKERPEFSLRLSPKLPFLAGEVVYAARHEMAMTVEDVLSHRMRVLLLDARTAASIAKPVAELLARELGWDAARMDEEAARFTSLAESSLSMLGGTDEPSQPPKSTK